VLCLGYLGEQIAARLGRSACGVDLAYSYDGPTLLGTGGALRRAVSLLGEACWVVYGDSYMDIDYRAVWSRFDQSGALALMVVLGNEGRWDKSNVVFRDGRLLKYDKRVVDPEMTYIDYGVALLRREIVERIPENQPFDLADLYSRLVAERVMVGYEVTERFYEIGSPEGLAEAERLFASRQGARRP
jgi:NDP-sugar pyrophosphorylase family protein